MDSSGSSDVDNPIPSTSSGITHKDRRTRRSVSDVDDPIPSTSSGITHKDRRTRRSISNIDDPMPSTSSGIIHEDPRKKGNIRISKKRKIEELPMKDREIQEFLMGESSDSEIESDVESFETASELEELSEEDAAEVDSATPVGEVPTPLEGDVLWFADPQVSCEIVPFTASSGLKVRPLGDHPIHYFHTMFSEEMYELILRETNRHGFARFSSSKHPRSHLQSWRDVSREELDVFLGLLFHMGNIKISTLQDYWRVDDLYNQPVFRNNMSRDRFFSILRALHFVRNPREGEQTPTDPLYKIRPLLNLFRNNVKKIYYPAKNLCLDESLVMWRGRLYFRQYIKTKKHKYGIKLYLLCEPNGFVLNQIVYLGSRDAELGGKGHTQKVVKELTKDYFHSGHAVYMDSYYNSLELTQDLLTAKTLATGTLSLARKGNPPEVVSKKLKKGEIISRYTKDGICVMKWMDKRIVSAISSEHRADIVNATNRRGRSSSKPKIIVEYNKNMGGIDKSDQMLAYYYVERRTLRWYIRLALHVLQTMLNNSFILYKNYGGRNIRLNKFREEVIRFLIYKRETISILPKKPKCDKVHLPVQIKGGFGGRVRRKKCKVCTSKGLRKDVIFFCPACEDEPGLCLEPCFRQYHKY